MLHLSSSCCLIASYWHISALCMLTSCSRGLFSTFNRMQWQHVHEYLTQVGCPASVVGEVGQGRAIPGRQALQDLTVASLQPF